MNKTRILGLILIALMIVASMTNTLTALEKENEEISQDDDSYKPISKDLNPAEENKDTKNDFVFGFIFSIVTYYQEYEDYYRAEVNGFYIIWYHMGEDPGIYFYPFINEPWSDKNLDFWFGIANQFLITGFFLQDYPD